MEKQEIYSNIETKANIGGNGHCIFGDDPVYHFEPGNTPLPHRISVVYHSGKDEGLVSLENSSAAFLDELQRELGAIVPRAYQSSAKNARILEFDNFKRDHIAFAEALDRVLSRHRIFIPSLLSKKFNKDSDAEYSLRTEYGTLWAPGHVCNGAMYDLLFASFDFDGFESYEEIRDYAVAMIRIHQDIRRNYFKAALKKDRDHIDLCITAEAVSKDKVKADIEKMIEIVSESETDDKIQSQSN